MPRVSCDRQCMDARGTGSFENDLAADWLGFLLNHVDDVVLVDTALDLVAGAAGRADAGRCQEALAAAELVAAAGHKPCGGIDAATLAWVEQNWTALWQERRRKALATVRAILESSALLEEWRARPDFDAWNADVGNLVERLS